MPTPDSALILQTLKVFAYVGQCSVMLPILIAVWRRTLLSQSLRVMLYCCLMWMTLMALGVYVGKVWHYNVFVWQLVDLLEVWFIGWAYYHVIRFRLRRHFLLIGVLYSLFALFDSFILNGLWDAALHKLASSNTYTVVLKNLLIIGLILLYFEQTLRDLRNTMLEYEPMFIISVALIVFFAGTVVMFLIRFDIKDSTEYTMTLPVDTVLNLVLHGLLARAFWLAGRQQKPMLPQATASAIRE